MALVGESPSALVFQTIREHQLGHLDAAIELYQRALDLDPGEPDALNLLGALHLQRGDLAAAVPYSARAVIVDPRSASAFNNLGLLLKQAGQSAAAASCYQKSIMINIGFADAHTNLGVLLKAEGHVLQAIQHYKAAIDLDPTLGEAYNNLANAYQEIGEIEEAIEAYLRASEQLPDSDTVHYNVGMLLDRQGQQDEALVHLRRALEINPDRNDAQHLVAALEGRTTRTAPSDYVRALFDDYAYRFEAHLVGDLHYRTHKEIVDLLGQHRSNRRFATALDLGCGTGLVGAPMRGCVDRLIGVDLSEKMLRQASAKGVYDELVASDITAYLAETDEPLDLVLAGDVFVYIGALDEVFALIAKRLAPGGLCAFSVEAEVPAASWVLRPSGRYGHGDAYISTLLAEVGLVALDKHATVLRKERGQPIDGMIYIAAKPK